MGRPSSNIFRATLLIFCNISMVACALAPGMRPPAYTPSEQSLEEAKHEVIPLQDAILPKQNGTSSKPAPISTTLAQKEYRLGVRDVLQIVVWNHPQLKTTSGSSQDEGTTGFMIEADGGFFFPYAGKIEAAGKTTEEVRRQLTIKLRSVVKTPQVSVSVQKYASQRIYVLGEVNNPGILPLQGYSMTIMEAIALAGGLTERASGFDAYLLRGGQRLPVNIPALFKNGDMSQNVTLQDKDILQVPDNSKEKVYILGAVRQPRIVNLAAGQLNLSEALMAGGGMDPLAANADDIYVIRGTIKEPKIYHLSMKSADAILLGERFQLQSRDVIYVSTAKIVQWNRVLSLIMPNIQSLFYLDVLSTQ